MNRQFTAEDMLQDPGYQFRMEQQQQALERSAAARGNVQGGGHLKSLSRYLSGLASQEYGAAADRFERSRQGKFSNLMQIVGLGANAAERSGANTIGAATASGDYKTGAAQYSGNAGMRSTEVQAQNTLGAGRMRYESTIGAGNARAAGHVGAANAWNGALSSIGKGVDGAIAGGFGGSGGGFSLRGMVRGY